MSFTHTHTHTHTHTQIYIYISPHKFNYKQWQQEFSWYTQIYNWNTYYRPNINQECLHSLKDIQTDNSVYVHLFSTGRFFSHCRKHHSCHRISQKMRAFFAIKQLTQGSKKKEDLACDLTWNVYATVRNVNDKPDKWFHWQIMLKILTRITSFVTLHTSNGAIPSQTYFHPQFVSTLNTPFMQIWINKSYLLNFVFLIMIHIQI